MPNFIKIRPKLVKLVWFQKGWLGEMVGMVVGWVVDE